MARAYKCDRCGTFYEYKMVNLKEMFYDGLNLTRSHNTLTLLPDGACYKNINFCPNCIMDFVNFMNEGENKHETT